MTKQRKVIVAAFTCICASIFSLVTATFAWFAANTQVETTGIQISVKAPDIARVDLEIFRTTDITGNVFTYEENASLTEFEIPRYDAGEILFNEYKKALVLHFIVEMNPIDQIHNFNIDMICSDDCFDFESSNSISNAISMYKSTKNANETKVDTTGNSEQTYITQTVLNKTGTRYKDVTTISLCEMSFPVSSSNQTKDVYFVMKYNMLAIDAFAKNGTGIITFSDDLLFKLE